MVGRNRNTIMPHTSPPAAIVAIRSTDVRLQYMNGRFRTEENESKFIAVNFIFFSPFPTKRFFKLRSLVMIYRF